MRQPRIVGCQSKGRAHRRMDDSGCIACEFDDRRIYRIFRQYQNGASRRHIFDQPVGERSDPLAERDIIDDFPIILSVALRESDCAGIIFHTLENGARDIGLALRHRYV